MGNDCSSRDDFWAIFFNLIFLRKLVCYDVLKTTVILSPSREPLLNQLLASFQFLQTLLSFPLPCGVVQA
jgi:hypothetical protein